MIFKLVLLVSLRVKEKFESVRWYQFWLTRSRKVIVTARFEQIVNKETRIGHTLCFFIWRDSWPAAFTIEDIVQEMNDPDFDVVVTLEEDVVEGYIRRVFTVEEAEEHLRHDIAPRLAGQGFKLISIK